MPIDTRNRRASCLGINGAYRAVFPNPDGSIAAQADRQQNAYTYPGILADAPAAFDPTILARVVYAGRPWQFVAYVLSRVFVPIYPTGGGLRPQDHDGIGRPPNP